MYKYMYKYMNYFTENDIGVFKKITLLTATCKILQLPTPRGFCLFLIIVVCESVG